MDPDKDAPKDSPQGDDELENLSSDEKAAFEKIMAEIAAATGGAPKSSADDAARKSATVAEPPSSSAAPATDKVQPPADENQANLDQILSEISSRKGTVNAAPGTISATAPVDPPADDLSEDQQAALDQIMAEIGSKRKAEKAPAPVSETEELSQDQQAALDSIMAEIGSKRKAEKLPDPGTVDHADEPLNADQQAALDNIMAEIGSKRKAEKENDQAADTGRNAPVGEESAADIEKIMAEIEAKKSRDPVKSASSAQPPAEDNAAAPKKSENLTMEEFDDELSSLLQSAAAKPSGKSKTAEALKTEGIKPAALVEKVKATEPPPANPDKAAEEDGPQTRKEYPILKEVDLDPKSKPKKSKGSRPGREPKRAGRKVVAAAVVAMGLLILCGGGYWGYRYWRQAAIRADAAIPAAGEVQTAEVAAGPVAVSPTGTPGPPPVQESPMPAVGAQMQTPASMLSAAKNDLNSARQQIQTKISDIQQLKSYYGRGIEEETRKIEDALQSGKIPSFDAALADKKIELAMRAVQRRQTYIGKLGSPLAQLTAMSEQLLYLERRARIYEVLQGGITGLPIEGFKKEVDETIGRYLAFNTQISIDQVELQPTDLETIWSQIEAELKQKANLLAQRAPLNRAISAEICKGNYERKYLLDALSTETAQCLVKWDGQDLYLNNLTELTPEVARILAQWPGEWISLNGLRQLHPESAMYLSQWPGKRISLNGLSELSPEATAHLSKWKGGQLELVGLQSIGSWENYGTRLYLSEKLRKQLEAQ